MIDNPLSKLNTKGFYIGIIAVVTLVFTMLTVGINDNGFRTVVQWPNGKTFVKFEPGIYLALWGRTTVYPDVMTFEFDSRAVGKDGQMSHAGVPVRYQDGGTGHVFGVTRFQLPSDELSMLNTHKAFRDYQGLYNKLFSPLLKESLNLTAGLMTSEEAYAEKRNDYSKWGEDQVRFGKYQTSLVEKTVIVEPEELDGNGRVIKKAVTRVTNVPVITFESDNVTPKRGISPLTDYGITVTGFNLVDWTFEPKTLEQISNKRAANMAVITAQANASKAKQEKLQKIAEGERNVAEAKYREEVKKIEAVVIAEREKEVATINAARQVAVNEQNYLAQIEDVKAAGEEAKAIELRSTAEADAKKRILEADGALQQKLATYEKVNARFASEFGKQKWVPELVMGSGTNGTPGTSNAAAVDLIDLLTAKTAKDLQLDMSIKAGAKTN